MAALCGYSNGDANSPVGCRDGSSCVIWATPAVFACGREPSIAVAQTCIEAGQPTSTPVVEVTSCPQERPYCATVALYWSGSFYYHWECVTEASLTATLLSTPTFTANDISTSRSLEEFFVVTTYPTSTNTGSSSESITNGSNAGINNGGNGGSSGSSGNIGTIVGAIAGVVGAITAIPTIFYLSCTKRHQRHMEGFERERLDIERSRNRPNNERAVQVRRPEAAARFERNGQGVNLYIREFHYHDHGGGGQNLGRLLK